MPSATTPNARVGAEQVPSPQLNVARLARSGGAWVGTVTAGSFERMGAMLGERAVEVALEFSMDDQGRPRVAGNCRLTVQTCCGRCSETVEVDFESAIDFRVVASEAQAQALMPTCDVVVAEAGVVGVSDLIEDDLLLSVPANGCADPDACPHARDLALAVEGTDVPEDARPFAALRDLAPSGSTA